MQSEIGVVFDCNVLLQAAARKSSPSASCLRLAENEFIRLYIPKRFSYQRDAAVESEESLAVARKELTSSAKEELKAIAENTMQASAGSALHMVSRRAVPAPPDGERSAPHASRLVYFRQKGAPDYGRDDLRSDSSRWAI